MILFHKLCKHRLVVPWEVGGTREKPMMESCTAEAIQEIYDPQKGHKKWKGLGSKAPQLSSRITIENDLAASSRWRKTRTRYP